ncbi:fimbrial protein [Pseudomonas alkylphenolica]|uniref:fimbrial protein n=1 Tax=Pseudomonas alkylphenolica TaxID=237609 RepID=UPI0018D9BD37|nr:fimbrial protein [Pseudomonas alkylphenolica]MBH3428899.1 fimbrial protein [Pseudomonas alkylphenolica]
MKKSLIAAAILASSAFASMANAADGTINFTGAISATTCKVATGSGTVAVAMGTFSPDAFSTPGHKTAPQAVNITVNDCPAAITTASITFSGVADDDDSSLLGLTKGTGSSQHATGVAIGFFEEDGTTPIALNTGASSAKPLAETVDNPLNFVARYVATGATVAAGLANANADFTIKYN